MTNREYINTLSNEEWSSYIYSTILRVGKQYNDSVKGVAEWLSRDKSCWCCDKGICDYHHKTVKCTITGETHHYCDDAKCNAEGIK